MRERKLQLLRQEPQKQREPVQAQRLQPVQLRELPVQAQVQPLVPLQVPSQELRGQQDKLPELAYIEALVLRELRKQAPQGRVPEPVRVC